MMESLLMVTVVLFALVIGYAIGLMQKGINIHHHGEEFSDEYNTSVGQEEYMDYFDKNVKVRE